MNTTQGTQERRTGGFEIKTGQSTEENVRNERIVHDRTKWPAFGFFKNGVSDMDSLLSNGRLEACWERWKSVAKLNLENACIFLDFWKD